jgi:hypothetical protein
LDPDATATQPTPAVQPAAPPPSDPESTTQIRAVRAGPRHGGGRHGARPETGVESTQTMPSVDVTGSPGGSGGSGGSDDFDSLFRSASHHTPQDGPPPPPPQGRAAARRAEGRSRRRFPVAMVLAVVLTSALVGLVAGAALNSGGGSDDAEAAEQADGGAGGSGGGSGEGEGAGPAPGEGDEEEQDDEAAARQQAEDLSALLEDSNNSRDAVISAVEDIRSCRQLAKAARDLRAAADQRNGLVDRLDELDLGQLPDGEALATALTEAWEASAEADEHYAGWADDARTHRGEVCRRGQARHTESTGAGDQASGTATQAKERAAGLWNPIAREYGLPERAASQL